MNPQNKTDGVLGINRREFTGATAAAAAGAVLGIAPKGAAAAEAQAAQTSKILNYNPEMEYRRCGKTGWMVSAVCLGGHWKRVDKLLDGFKSVGWNGNLQHAGFQKNRADVVTRCIERGMNYIDACTAGEILAYSKALKGRRDKMYLGWSWYEKEARFPDRRTAAKLLETLDYAMQQAGEQYVDLWRLVAVSDARKGPNGERLMAHTEAESEQIAKALAEAKKQGKVRHTGVSSHDRVWLEYMIKTFPNEIEVVVTPYTAKTKVLEKSTFFEAVQKHDVGVFGIKPFSSYAIFKGNGAPDPKNNPHIDEDNRLARMAIRYILCNPAITAPIPGLASEAQVDNMALAILERKELDAHEKAELDRAMDRAWANLPQNYQWLKDWEYV